MTCATLFVAIANQTSTATGSFSEAGSADAGYGFELRSAYRSGYTGIAAASLLTVLTWAYVFLA